jgi:Na+-transporting methylmalonyl-CoA/oxaloacetate decarboxylase gamma subunit
MSAVAIVLIVLAVLVLLVLAGGFAAARRREREHAGDYARHLAEADQALEQARAADRGWDRAVMEAAVTKALEEQRPGFTPDRVDLVLVDDRPGVTEDRAQFVAAAGGEEILVVLSRGEAGWAAESVG